MLVPDAPLLAIAQQLRAEAESLEAYAAPAAVAKRDAAERIEAAHNDLGNEVLSIKQGAVEKGRNYEALRRCVVGSVDLNAGTVGAPAIRRRDLDRLPPGRGKRAGVSTTQVDESPRSDAAKPSVQTPATVAPQSVTRSHATSRAIGTAVDLDAHFESICTAAGAGGPSHQAERPPHAHRSSGRRRRAAGGDYIHAV